VYFESRGSYYYLESEVVPDQFGRENLIINKIAMMIKESQHITLKIVINLTNI
jgi:hypothetical protein